jgi:multidrug resistance efflux pump
MLETFIQSWLASQCQMITGVDKGVVILGAAGRGPFTLAARWPQNVSDAAELLATAQTALAKRSSIVRVQAGEGNSSPHQYFAYPLAVHGQLCGIIAMEIASHAAQEQRDVLQLLRWGSAWLEILIRQQAVITNDRLVTALQLVATALEHESLAAAINAVANELATRLGCDRVSLGFVSGRRVRLRALSHGVQFDPKANLVHAIEAAMEEALDQDTSVIYPDAGSTKITRAHADLAQRHEVGALCTMPLSSGGRLFGALTLERPSEQAFDPETVELIETVAALLGPIFESKRREQRGFAAKIRDSLRAQLNKLLGPRHTALKLSVAVLASLLAWLWFAEGDYRVSAAASLEGSVQRSVVALLDGYVARARARAGDLVSQGDILFQFDDRDLQLERLKWASQYGQYEKEYRDALANHEFAKVTILKAQLDQVGAQLALVEEQLARSQGIAPVDGIIVSGDLSQMIGAPMKRGQVLFEIAPLDQYRVILKVDEREIVNLAVGQQGRLALAGAADKILPFTVTKITPVSEAKDGHNTFRVEARLEQTPPLLRPGMAGVGKIEIGPRRLIWIWTHSLLDWLRLWVWSWWP